MGSFADLIERSDCVGFKARLPRGQRRNTGNAWRCSKCNEVKPAAQFSKGQYVCKSCFPIHYIEPNRELVSTQQRTNWLLKYKLTEEQYKALLHQQGGRCAICRSPNPRRKTSKNFFVDHDRKCCPKLPTCGRCTRGLLCSYCNSGLGYFEDNIVVLQGAISYLRGAPQ